MNLRASSSPQSPAGSVVTPLLRAVLLADLVDSTAFIERFGDERAAVALQRLDLQIRDLLEFTGGRLIDKADGLLAIFERPIQAVDFALRYQQALRHFSSSEGSTLTARVGIHVGEVMTWSNSESAVAAGAKPLEVEGLAKPVAGRLMSLALPGQILVSSMAQSLAQRAQAELGERADRVRWLMHGRYRFKGVPAPLLVHEVGEQGFAPLSEPPSGQKVWRELPIWRRPPVLAAELALFVLIGAFYLYTAVRSPPALAFNERDWVVIGDMSNFTADPRLEDSLDTALRVGLEQSRFINIVPDVKVRSALDRMGRGPNTTIDRAVGSEIAIREGARALLLPTVAEVGGSLRISLEVVDPTTQKTVFAESAEGRGMGSLLPSLDTVSVGMREKLGEAVRAVKTPQKPLPDVTTSNLNALRAYTIGQKRYAENRLAESAILFQEAIRLDPDFALAHIAVARLSQSRGDMAGYERSMAKAKSLRGRLTHREMLLLDADLGNYGPAAEALDRWRLLTEIYPDEYSAYYRFSLASWHHSYQQKQALEFLGPAMHVRNPRRRSAYYLQGVLLQLQERYAESLASFAVHDSLGRPGYNRQHAEAFAVQRRYAEAEAMLARQKPTGLAEADFPLRLGKVVFPLDRGHWQEGGKAMDQLVGAAAKVNADTVRRAELSRLSLRALANDPKLSSDLRDYVASQRLWMDNPNHLLRISDTFTTLMAGVLAAEKGDIGTARKALEMGRETAQGSGYPVLKNAVAMVEAALLVQAGKPGAAVERLLPLHDGSELYLSHAVLMRSLAAAGRFPDAAREAAWLSSHRGRAYGEFNIDQAVNAANVAQSNLALLDEAEYLLKAAQPEKARQSLKRFYAAWPQAGRLAFLTTRLQRLQSGLGLAAPKKA